MTKKEFIGELRQRLCGLPKADIEEHVAFWSEMIDDRIEEGYDEQSAVADVGAVEEIAAQIINDTPITRIAKERIRPKRRLETWETVLLIAGSPIWLSLAIAALAVLISFYAVLLSVVVSVWAVFASLAACGVGGVIAGIVFTVSGNGGQGIAMIGAGIVCAGLAILTFFGCKAATCGIVSLTAKIALGIKGWFIKGEKNNE